MTAKHVKFLASIPPLQSAFTVDGAGGMRMKLDLDEMQMGVLGDLLGMRGKLLRVTIEAIPPKRQAATTPEWGDDDGEETEDEGDYTG